MIPNDQDFRQAAESLLHSGSQNVQSPALDISHSQSINTIPSLHPDYIISEDILAGHRLQGRMSNVRRFFCLFVTFDLLFTGLMWLICVMLKGENVIDALKEQIYHYNIHTSLFDVVLAALSRFVILLLFYALIYINHWIIIAFSTTVTCVFLVAKVVEYDWQHSSQPVFEVLLVLISFVLSWGEAWFLDFRVLPQESNARRYLISSIDTERAPLIRNYVNGLPSVYTESEANFYSPLVSPTGSLFRFNTRSNLRPYPPVQLTYNEEKNYKTTAAKTMQDAWDLLNKPDWKLKKKVGNDCIYYLDLPSKKRIFKLDAQVSTSARYLLDELFYNVERIPSWNRSLLESHKIQEIDEQTDISYQISADDGIGIVSSRDFVSLRSWEFIDSWYIIANQSTEHPSLPKNKKYIRGENGVGCWAMQELPNTPNKCNFQWILNTNLKGWLVQSVCENAFIDMMFDYIKNLRIYVGELRESGKLA